MHIKGAQPYIPGYTYLQKETFINKNDDIRGSSCNPLYKHINKIAFVNRTDDISGA